MQVRDGDDPEHTGLDLENNAVGKSADEAPPCVLRHDCPRIGKFKDTSDSQEDFLSEFNAESRPAVFIIPHRLVEFIVRLRMKIESHRRYF